MLTYADVCRRIRAGYISPSMPTPTSNAATRPPPASQRAGGGGGGGGGGGAPVSHAPASVPLKQVEGRGKEAVDTKWEAVRNKVRKAMFETFQTHQEAFAAIDPESGGACFFFINFSSIFSPIFFPRTKSLGSLLP